MPSMMLGAVLCLGCGETPNLNKAPIAEESKTAKNSEPAKSKQPDSTPNHQAQQTPPAVLEPAAPAIIPKIATQNLFAGNPPANMPGVSLSAAHEKACLVKVGDKFPSGALPDQAGKVQELDKLRGRYTLVVFWTANESAALEQLVDIEQMIWPAYKNLGLQVIAINPLDGNTPAAKAKLAPLKLSFPLLNDANGKFFGTVGINHLPRTYLLDGQGKILWFDLEYSRTTRRLLLQALSSIWREI
jgi:peroxiredoxin